MSEELKIDLTNPEVKSLVDAAIAEATKGLKENRDTILNEKKTLEERIKELNTTFDGVDPKVLKSLAERMKNDEETKLIAEGKIDEVLARRTDALRKDLESKLTQKDQLLTQVSTEKEQLNSRIRDVMVEGLIRQAASEVGLHASAIDDAIYRGKGVFQLDADFRPLAKASDGTTLLGKDAKSPLSAKEWLESMKEKAPHWFPGSSGAGAAGSKGGAGGGADGQLIISRADARNPQKYQAAKAQAEKAGVSLQIVD